MLKIGRWALQPSLRLLHKICSDALFQLLHYEKY